MAFITERSVYMNARRRTHGVWQWTVEYLISGGGKPTARTTAGDATDVTTTATTAAACNTA